MKKNLHQVIALSFLLLSFGALAFAGEIKGKVEVHGMRSAQDIAVYVDAIPGKTFTPPANAPVEDQKHMTFVPHVLVVLKGTHGAILEQRSGGAQRLLALDRPQQKACSQHGHLAAGSAEVVHV